jgi:hypothetical protein
MAQLTVMVARMDKAEHYLRRLKEDLKEIMAMVPARSGLRFERGLAGRETGVEEPRKGTRQAHDDRRHAEAGCRR